MSNFGENPYQSPYSPQPIPPNPPQQQGMLAVAILSIVFGILGLFPGCCCVLLGIPLQLLALGTGGFVLANPNAPGRGLAIAGVVLGGIGLMLQLGWLVMTMLSPDLANQFQQFQRP